MAICKSRNGEIREWNGGNARNDRRVWGIQGIWVRMQGIWVGMEEMQGMGVGMPEIGVGIRGMQEISVGMQRIRLGIREIGVRMQRIRMGMGGLGWECGKIKIRIVYFSSIGFNLPVHEILERIFLELCVVEEEMDLVLSKDGVKSLIGTSGKGCILSGLTENSLLILGVRSEKEVSIIIYGCEIFKFKP